MKRRLLHTDYHMHPQGHRHQPYSVELLQPWADSCRSKGIVDLVFTDHDRYHAGVCFDAIDRLREANPDLRIRAGIELDNDPVTGEAGFRWVERNWERLDFVLGSVHYLTGESAMFDASDQAGQFERIGVERAYELYRNEVLTLLRRGFVDCLGHLDLIKIHKFRHPTQTPADFFAPVLDEAARVGVAIEINTAGWRKPVGEVYPEPSLLKAAIDRGLWITLSSDAHSHVQVGESYDRVGAILSEVGLDKLAVCTKHQFSWETLEVAE